MKPIKRKDQKERRQPSGMTCRILLTYEKARSERLNRFFSFCGMTFSDIESGEIIDLLKEELRPSDYVFEVPSTDESGEVILKLGLLLPETDLKGAEIVKKRINQMCNYRKLKFQIGLVTYPDDATLPGVILEKAFKEDFPKGIDENKTEFES